MADIEEKVQLGWLVPISIREAFRDFCIANGFVVQEDCAGSLIVWQHLPAAIRERAKLEAKGIVPADKQFWKQFEAGLELGIQAQLNIQQQKPVKPRKK